MNQDQQEAAAIQWWLSAGKNTEGPFPMQDISGWLKSGQLSPDIMACPEGSTTWHRLRDIDEFAELAQTASAPQPPRFVANEALVTDYSLSFEILTAAIVFAVAFSVLNFLFLGVNPNTVVTVVLVVWLAIWIGAIATWAAFHYALWRILPSHFAMLQPNQAVGFLFIPFFNCYWVFRSYVGITKGLNAVADSEEIPGMRANTHLAWAAALFMAISFLVSFASSVYSYLEFFELFFALISFVLWLLMVLEQRRMVEHLAAHNAPLNSHSRLIKY